MGDRVRKDRNRHRAPYVVAKLVAVLLLSCTKNLASSQGDRPRESSSNGKVGGDTVDEGLIARTSKARCRGVTEGQLSTTHWFVMFESVQELDQAIRESDLPSDLPLLSYEKANGFLRTPNAEWSYLTVAGKVVATSHAMTLPSRRYYLRMSAIGDFVLSMQGISDYLCPSNQAEECYPLKGCDPNLDDGVQTEVEAQDNDTPPDMCCENPPYASCVAQGERLQIEVLDVPNEVVYRVEDLRFATLQEIVEEPGALRIVFDVCELRLQAASVGAGKFPRTPPGKVPAGVREIGP